MVIHTMGENKADQGGRRAVCNFKYGGLKE